MIKRTLLAAFLICSIMFSFASEVSIEKAKRVAAAFYFEQAVKDGQDLSLNEINFEQVESRTNAQGQEVMYLFSNETEGWVIVSADDIFRPVLAYSLDSKLSGDNTTFDSWVSGYINEYDYAQEVAYSGNEETMGQWNFYVNATEANLANQYSDAVIVDPLLTCIWNQDDPYNMLCPEDPDGPGGHVYAGCVATAMSMIMYYYKFPEVGNDYEDYYYPGYGTISANFGETYYQWDAMMDDANNSSEHTKYAIAELQFHCGVSVNMMYGPDGSGAYSYNVPNAIQSYFRYSDDAQHLSKDMYSWDSWYDMLRAQHDALQPVYYSGSSDEGGHAFVCDGYDDADMFHFNFGWGGYDNGFFTLYGANALNYDNGQAMVRNFYPSSDETYPYFCGGDKDLAYYSGSFEDGSGPIEPYAPNSDCSWLLQAPSELDLVSGWNIYVKSFDLAAGDFLTVYEGGTTSDPVYAQYTGGDTPEDLTINSPEVLVTFTSSSATVDNEGFRIQYKANRPSFCSGVEQFTEPVGTINDGSEEFNYVTNTQCQYSIQPPNATSVTLTFSEFEVDNDGDFIQIYQLSPNALLGEFSIDNPPTSVTSETGKMHIMFQTDGYGSAAGFTANYEIGNIGVESNTIDQLNVYPNPANSQITVDFVNTAQGNVNLMMTDLSGKTVYTQSLENTNGKYSHQIAVDHLSKGVYFLEIRSAKGSEYTKVVVK